MKMVADFMVEVPLLKRDDTVTKARQILRDDSFREIYIHDGKKKLLGYIDITDVLQVRSTKSNVTVEGFMKEPAAVLENTPIEHAVRSIREFRTDSAAVTDAKRYIIGGVIISDLFPIIITRHEIRGLAGDYMTRKVISCAPEDPVQKVYNLIIESGFSAFPVIKKDKCLGIISRRDLLKAGRVRSVLENHASTPIETIMTKTVISVSPEEPIQSAAALMVRYDISRVPVLESTRVVGILDRHDVMKALALT
jgi:CBS domain-containing protein